MNSSRSRLETTGETVTEAFWTMLGDETLSAANGLELLERLLYLLRGVRGHTAGTQDGLAHVDGRVDARVRIDALFQERLPEHHGRVLIADVHRHDWRLGLAHVEAQAAQPLAPHRAQLLEARDHLRLALQDGERGQGSGDRSGRQAGAEEHGPREVLDPLQRLPGGGDEAAYGGEGLGEGGHHQVHFLLQPE